MRELLPFECLTALSWERNVLNNLDSDVCSRVEMRNVKGYPHTEIEQVVWERMSPITLLIDGALDIDHFS